MERKWGATIAKTGVIKIGAKSKEEVLECINNFRDIPRIYWEDSWSIVDIQEFE